uniref:Replication protein VP4 n=1 Tax=Gokushovirinae environmental samples TaxID=1478972 RepID=A0A2R3UAH2_9VIRU|nr:replication protein VP4 [Gokushovirinae environmental samples]
MASGFDGMPCYSPLRAFQVGSGKPVFSPPALLARAIFLPCGRCVGCLLERSRQWAVRCMHEARLYDRNCFITLTFRDCSIDSLNLDYVFFQKFMKRLRFHYSPNLIRFFMCGEYGDINSRAHYHACLFNHDFDDKVVFRGELFRSPTLERLWPFGFSTIGALTFESAAYVARYVMKKEHGTPVRQILDVTTGELIEREHEFCAMSLKPGIGRGFIEKFVSDVYPEDHVVINGKDSKPPRYYDTYFESIRPEEFGRIKERRRKAADRQFDDNSPRRLRVKAAVAGARLGLKKRGKSF